MMEPGAPIWGYIALGVLIGLMMVGLSVVLA